jgi:hypothetical protein
VCFHTDFRSIVLEYSLDEIVCDAAWLVNVGKIHDLYTPCKDSLKKRQEGLVLAIRSSRAISAQEGIPGLGA